MIPLVSLKKKQIVCSVFWDFPPFFSSSKRKKEKKKQLRENP